MNDYTTKQLMIFSTMTMITTSLFNLQNFSSMLFNHVVTSKERGVPKIITHEVEVKGGYFNNTL
jgi:hypothetical protein